MPTMYQNHVTRWKDCKQCSLCKGRKRVVLARGTIPCNILFIGEAPGRSEDSTGKPFTGPAGHMLDRIIKRAVPDSFTYALTNLVCCIPKDESGSKATEPSEEAIEACSERLREMVEICDPDLIVFVGRLSGKNGVFRSGCKTAEIVHPAAILRMDVSQKSLAERRATATVEDAVRDLVTF